MRPAEKRVNQGAIRTNVTLSRLAIRVEVMVVVNGDRCGPGLAGGYHEVRA